jgi:hypothetical protein
LEINQPFAINFQIATIVISFQFLIFHQQQHLGFVVKFFIIFQDIFSTKFFLSLFNLAFILMKHFYWAFIFIFSLGLEMQSMYSLALKRFIADKKLYLKHLFDKEYKTPAIFYRKRELMKEDSY